MAALLATTLAALPMVFAPAATGARPAHAPFPTATFQESFVDTTRPTAATPVAPATERRVLATTIVYPVGVQGRVPLVVLLHGNNGHPSKFAQLMNAWAAAGYVVAAPAFPLTSDATPGGSQTGDVVNQPADVSFVIDRLLALAQRKGLTPIGELVDPKRIAVAGLSLGGATLYALAFNSCCIDKRIDAAILMSAVKFQFKGGKEVKRHVPALLLHGDADPLYRISVASYPTLATPKWFVTLHGSTHAGPFEDSPDPADAVVPQVTIAFLDLYLKHDAGAAQRLVDAVQTYGQAEVRRKLR